jgi:hypothetical protein
MFDVCILLCLESNCWSFKGQLFCVYLCICVEVLRKCFCAKSNCEVSQKAKPAQIEVKSLLYEVIWTVCHLVLNPDFALSISFNSEFVVEIKYWPRFFSSAHLSWFQVSDSFILFFLSLCVEVLSKNTDI